MLCLNVTENASSRSSNQEEFSAPAEEHIDESVNVPIPPPVPSEPSQARPSRPPEPARVNIPLDQWLRF